MAAHRIYLHFTWSTLDRRPMIDAATREFLAAYVRRIAVRERVDVVATAFVRTHGNRVGLRWSPEYSVTSVSPRMLNRAIRYLASQDAHHPGEEIRD